MSDNSAPAVPSAPAHAAPGPTRLLPLTLTALGVVYGDIGTSPLYAINECFYGSHGVPPTAENVLGVLSLIIYALVLVISIKYVLIVMRADNQGEGGILALTALVPGKGTERIGASRLAVGRPILIALGIFGTATLPAFRRRGLQSAIVARAMNDALGRADLVIATTEPGSVSQRTFVRWGFQVIYTRAILAKS